jgi:GH15 family glucan-1,4-alpha-glucosidase
VTRRVDVETILVAQTENGAILACPDYPTYRYSWLRDGAFCAVALDRAGQMEASGRFHDWVAARVLAFESPMRRAIEAVAIGAEPAGGDLLPCRFASSGHAPTGDGWGAFQMDGPGLWLWALREYAAVAGRRDSLDGGLMRAAAIAAEYVAALWRSPSFDAWEEHGDHLSTSTLGACLAGLLAAHRLGLEIPGMQPAVEGIRLEVAARGRRLGYLPRSDADDDVDASLLWCGPQLGAFHHRDPAWRATLERIEAELVGPDGGVYRYRADTFYGGGQWPVLTAALGLARLARSEPGDAERASADLAWIEDQRGPDGSLAEQSSARALQPDRLPEWEDRWGPVARPLTWSHAMTMLLTTALEVDAS